MSFSGINILFFKQHVYKQYKVITLLSSSYQLSTFKKFLQYWEAGLLKIPHTP